jgi:hypothetical protein
MLCREANSSDDICVVTAGDVILPELLSNWF